mmetsp:Transcript_28552/g.50744  ORF Transcript_28552/g.50744 Transcript_28552/m.50744 type:complete len:209 (-) Transcript_28552:1233-1859(-)
MNRMPFLIGIAGGTASGKTSFCRKLIEQLHLDSVLLEMDLFYRPLAPGQTAEQVNFDHPSMIDFDYINQVVDSLMAWQPTEVPIYNFKTNSREPEMRTLTPNSVIFYEGIYALYDPALRQRMKLKLFVHTDDEIRLVRRIQRDTIERGRDLDSVLNQYLNKVKPAFEEFIQPTMKHADIIIPNWNQNPTAVEMVVTSINSYLAKYGEP